MAGVELCAHDPAWPARFEAEAACLRAIMGEAAVAIDHIGSTSVPGLIAKPVIDILVTATSLAAVDALTSDFVASGYEARGEYGLAGRRYFCKSAPDGMRTHHIHVYQSGDPAITRHRAFRDYLRAHPDVASDYAALKQGLAAKSGTNRSAYQAAKSDWVRQTEARALAWRRALDLALPR